MDTEYPGHDPRQREFEALAQQASRRSLLGEFWEFLAENKKWWLLPIVATLAALGALIAISGTPAAPFIYPLF